MRSGDRQRPCRSTLEVRCQKNLLETVAEEAKKKKKFQARIQKKRTWPEMYI